MDQQPPTPPPIEPQPELPPIDFGRYVIQNEYGQYAGAIFLQGTLLLNIADELPDYMATVHANTVRNIVSRYADNQKISRTHHKQLMAVVRNNLERWELEKVKFLEDVRKALEQAERIEVHCAELAAKERSRKSAGNVVFIKTKTA
jgi:hypothetical protein